MGTSPGIPTENGEYNPLYDPTTIALTNELNSVIDQVPTNRFTQRAYILTNGDVGILPDTAYNVGFHQAVFDKDQVTFIAHYESPDVPVTQLPFSKAIYDTTVTIQQPAQLKLNLRSPGINEGY